MPSLSISTPSRRSIRPVLSLVLLKPHGSHDDVPEALQSGCAVDTVNLVGAEEVELPTDYGGCYQAGDSDRVLDWLLVERVRLGDKRAYEQLVVKYQSRIHRMLSRMVRDATEVEDITQEAFIKAYRALPQFRGESAFYTWLYRIAQNSARNYLVARRRKVWSVSELNAEEPDAVDTPESLQDITTPESVLMSKQVGQVVDNALQELPEELRTAITLREMEGLSYDEIAECMNCPVGTVRSRIFRAREAIAQHLRPLLGTSKEKRW
jgi:RNA polymerase sigma-70 factor (ECF subfamily)